MQFSTLIMVPSSHGGRRLKMLVKAEPRMSKLSGYQTKLVEKSRKPLARMFDKSFSHNSCHKAWCAVCSGSELKKP